jgi:hypothetical protein
LRSYSRCFGEFVRYRVRVLSTYSFNLFAGLVYPIQIHAGMQPLHTSIYMQGSPHGDIDSIMHGAITNKAIMQARVEMQIQDQGYLAH